MEPKMVMVKTADRCTGCRLCELACSFYHTGVFRPALSRIKVKLLSKEGFSFPLVCLQCKDAACIASCEPGAIDKNKKTGALVIDLKKCTGCKQCLSACPYGGMGYDVESDNPIACDLCQGDPKCVKSCFSKAIEMADLDAVPLVRAKDYVEAIRSSG